MSQNTSLVHPTKKVFQKYAFTFLFFLVMDTSVTHAQRNEYPSTSWGIGPHINVYNPHLGNLNQAGIAFHYEKNEKHWFSHRHSGALEIKTGGHNFSDYGNIALSSMGLFRITGDNGLYLSAGGQVRLTNEIGNNFYHKRIYYHSYITFGPAFSIGGSMRKKGKEYGAIEFIFIANPYTILFNKSRGPNIFQLNYFFPLKIS
ncbi:MAG: hypothetical protein JJU02_02790 [Cryomorphaceae bacterium]|nr:hypothetical protein [Cryomorphaceae bacterium]